MKKNIKIAMVAPPWAILGTSFDNIVKMYTYLSKKHGYDVTFFVDSHLNFRSPLIKTQKVFSPDYTTKFYKVLWFLGIPRFYYPSLVKKLEGFDIIETGTPEFNFYGYQCYKAAKKYKSHLFLRHSNTFYDFYLFRYTKAIALHMAKKFADYTTCFMFVNPDSRDCYINFNLIKKNDRRINIIGHAIDAEIFKPIEVEKPKKKILLSVGALLKLKGHQTIIRAFEKLEKNHPTLELWIVGDGKYRNELEKLCKELGVEKKARFLGRKNHNELVEIYNKSYILALANEQEVTPAVSEAMLCNKPVVAMDCGGVRFVIPDDSYGLVSKKDDLNDFTEKIDSLLSDRELYEKIASNGREYILSNFTIEKVAEKMHSCFSKVKN